MSTLKVVIIGGGAAGYFAALSCKEHHPEAEVLILEKSAKVLGKVKVSGGGRCNVTNAEPNVKVLATHYPRGEKQLRKLFGTFNTAHTIEWFESRGVPLHTYPDGHVFPKSNDSQTIIDCFTQEAERMGIQLLLKHNLTEVKAMEPGFEIQFSRHDAIVCDKIIVATGGHPKRASFDWMEALGHPIEEPVPSLFTFNMPSESIRKLQGIVVDPALARIQGTKLKAQGPLLITHWGMSGPAILKLSAWGARILEELDYQFKVQVSWVNELNENLVRKQLDKEMRNIQGKMMKNVNPWGIPTRLWVYLLDRSGINQENPWSQLGKTGANRLFNTLINDTYPVKGKTTFKEEFVTCGGVSLSGITMSTLESKSCPGMYFAGEVMDIDGITGGFNFQSAWTTGYIAGKLS